VQKHAKQLNCDANSKSFKDAMRYLWMPHLVDAHRRLLTHHADDDHHHHLQAADQADAYRYHTGMAGGVTSSSSDSFAPTTSESYAAAAASFLPKGWDPSAPSRYDDEMLASGGGDCWVPQDMSQQQQAGVVWPADEQQAAQAVNGTGGGQFVVDAELSGWVQGFSEGGVTTDENSFWTLEDIWKTQ
jgi:transcription factor MYB, plant